MPKASPTKKARSRPATRASKAAKPAKKAAQPATARLTTGAKASKSAAKKASAVAPETTRPAAQKKASPLAKARAKTPAGASPPAKKASRGADPNAAWWKVLEAAWKEVAPEHKATRKKMAANKASEDDYEEVGSALEEVVSALQARFDELSAPALLEVDRALERVLYQLDRQDIQEVTDGSDDGFLYCRGFLAAMGREYVEAVLKDPSVARVDCENGDVGYLPFHTYKRRFGKVPANGQGISRESCSNPEGWAE